MSNIDDKVKSIRSNPTALTILLFLTTKGSRDARQLSRLFEIDISLIYKNLELLEKKKLIHKDEGERPSQYSSLIDN